MVQRPKCYALVEDIFCTGYVAGEGSVFWAKSDDRTDDSEGTYMSDLHNDHIGTPHQKGSLLACWIREGDPIFNMDCVDITGKFSQRDRKNLIDTKNKLQYTGADDLYEKCGLSEIEPVRALDDFLHPVKEVNTLCFRGMQWTCTSGEQAQVTSVGKGHW